MEYIAKGKQKDVMALAPNGHFVILGVAGSGKSTVALLRAEFLAKLEPNENVLLITYNSVLAEHMQMYFGRSYENITVEWYHRFARGYLNSRGKCDMLSILPVATKKALIERALNEFRQKYPNDSTYKRPLNFFLDEIKFIQSFGLDTMDEYYNAERIGRSNANVKRENRSRIFELYEYYLQLRNRQGCLYDFDDIATYVYKEFCEDDGKRRYKHIIVDEGQDMTPMMLKSLAKAIPQDGSFMFLGDAAQQIYGSRLSWKHSGLKVDRIVKLDINYRNSQEIMEFANDITKNAHWLQEEDAIVAQEPRAKGPKPILVRFDDERSEINWVINRAINLGKHASIGIIVRRWNQCDKLKKELANYDDACVCVIKKEAGQTIGSSGIYLTTFHSAKGLEFDNVIIPSLSKEDFPDSLSFSEGSSEEDVYEIGLKLLYVAVTRAKFGLYMTYVGEMSDLLPKESEFCDYGNLGADI